MDNKNSLVKKSQKQPAQVTPVATAQEKNQQTPAPPLGFHHEIWDGDNTGWTKVTSKRRHKK